MSEHESDLITAVDQLDALPVGSVVISHDGYGEVYRKLKRRDDGIKWYEFGYALPWESGQISLPAKVLDVGVTL